MQVKRQLFWQEVGDDGWMRVTPTWYRWAGITEDAGIHQQHKIYLIQYSQTSLYNHLYKMTTCPRRLMLSPPKPIPIHLLLYKMTTCLMQPVATFLSSKWQKPCLKQPLQKFI